MLLIYINFSRNKGVYYFPNSFKLSGAYYFKQFFDNPELFREFERYYEKQRFRFKMGTADSDSTTVLSG